MTRHAELPDLGYLLLRDHTPEQLLDARNCTYGKLITDISKDGEEFESESPGDLQFYHFWKHEQNRGRMIGSWANASPATVTDFLKARPIFREPIDAILSPDARYEEADVDVVTGGTLPKGAPGITLAASNEDTEYKLFFPSSPPLIAHHLGASPPDNSALVFDIDNQGRMDGNRAAGLHSAWWVRKLPNQGIRNFFGENALAWNLTKSVGDQTGHGLYFASYDVSIPTPLDSGGRGTVVRRVPGPPQDGLAMQSRSMSGPSHPGHVSDKHRIGNGVDGPLNSGHISTAAYFYMDQIRDAPLSFERDRFPQVNDFGFPHLVHRRYDPDTLHPFLGGARPGLWREYVNVPFIVIVPPDREFPPPPPPDWPDDPTGGGEEEDPPPRDRGRPGGGDLGPGNPGPIIPVPVDEDKPPRDWPGELRPIGEGFRDTPGFQPGGGVRTPGVFETRAAPTVYETRTPYPILATPQKIGVPGFAVQGQPARSLERFGKYTPKPPAEYVDRWKKDFPMVAQVEGFGQETVPGRIVQDTGAKVYPTGTGKGGIAVFPPQTGMKDYDRGFTPPSGATQSTVDFTFFREKVRAFFGTPDAVLGEGINGVGGFLNSNGSMQWNGIDELGASDESKFVLFNLNTSVQGSTAPDLYVWNTDTTSSDEDSGYLILAGRTSSSARSMRMRMTHYAAGLQEIGVYDGTTHMFGLTEDGALRIKEGSVTHTDVSGYGNLFAKTDSHLYWRNDSGTEVNLSSIAGSGVTGPGSSTDHALSRWDGTGGGTLQDSNLVLDDDPGGAGTHSLAWTGTAVSSMQFDIHNNGTNSTSQLRIFANNNEGTPKEHRYRFAAEADVLKFYSIYDTGAGSEINWLQLTDTGASGTRQLGINETGVDMDVRILDSASGTVFRTDAGNGRVGLAGQSTPLYDVHIGPGSDSVTGPTPNLYVSDNGDASITCRDSTNNVEYWCGTDSFNGTYAVYSGSRSDHHYSLQQNGSNIVFLSNSSGQPVGVHTTTPSSSYKLDVGGAIHYSSATVSSERAWKKDIRDFNSSLTIPGNILDKIDLLSAKKYKWNDAYKQASRTDDTTKDHPGFIGNDVALVFPEFAHTWKSEEVENNVKVIKDRYGIQYEKMGAVLAVEGIKALHAKVKAQAIQIQNLEARVTALETP